VSEKSQATRTSKNVFEKSNSKTQYFVREVKARRMTKKVLSSSSGGVTFLLRKMMWWKQHVKEFPLMWWNQHVQEFPRLVRMVRQHLGVPATSVFPERLFSNVG
jgi:hypothetical protein